MLFINNIVIRFCLSNVCPFLLQIVFVELNGLIDQEWSHAAGQVCKIVVRVRSFIFVCTSYMQFIFAHICSLAKDNLACKILHARVIKPFIKIQAVEVNYSVQYFRVLNNLSLIHI